MGRVPANVENVINLISEEDVVDLDDQGHDDEESSDDLLAHDHTGTSFFF